ncbi:MAG: DUF1588 domain-containing protein [Polyangiaceae bacterium]|nr:DUF1588 domain-containing protein [Polyangiaceae bacterium]
MLRTIGPIALVLAAPALLAGCIGEIGDGSSEPPTNTGLQGSLPTTAIPRLSQREVEATIVDVFGIVGAAERNLAADPKSAVNPATNAEEEVFDTLAATKTPSQVFVDGLESLAFEVARDFSANTAGVDALAGCTPVQPLDDACLRSFIKNTGLRLWRRPMTDAEVDALVAAVGPLATDPAAGPNGHYVAVRGAISSLLVSPEFVYRTEIGTDVGGGVVALDNHELVARLSYFLWGTAPTQDLLDRAGGAEFSDDDVAALVDEMLADPRGIRQMRVFHELWLRYTSLLITDPALAADMALETSALVDRALAGVSETGDWRQLLTSTETFVSPALATHYGLSAPAEAGWVSYADGRVGLLSHGSFLSLSETKLTETLPSRRGAMIGRRLLCEVIMPPPPDVAVDMGVTVPEGSCKAEAYEAHATGTCKGCHQVIDGIGFGFERYDGVGRYREVEETNPACAIEGSGTYNGQTFSGPSEFVAANLDQISECAATNLVKFAIRDWGASDDQIERIGFAFEESHYDFGALMRAVAIDASFRHRVNEEVSQ